MGLCTLAVPGDNVVTCSLDCDPNVLLFIVLTFLPLLAPLPMANEDITKSKR